MIGTSEQRRLHNRQTIQTGFDALGDLYRKYWGEFFHLAVFEPGEQADDLRLAFERTHEHYFQAIRGAQAENVLDLACGGGALSRWMALRTKGQVVGVDFSSGQLAAAERLGRGIPNLRFVQHDIMDLESLAAGPFDAAVCLDAFCYVPDRPAALRAIASKLTPGARFLLVDWCRILRPTPLQRELILEPFYERWGIADLETADGYRRAFAGAGMDILTVEDLSPVVQPNWERAYQSAITAVSEKVGPREVVELAAVATKHGSRAITLAKGQFLVALLAKAAADAGLLRYISIEAQRSAPDSLRG
jgi:SAM-dependent methyltransferase